MKQRPNSMAQYSEMSDPDSNASKSTVIVVVLLVVLVCGGFLYFYLKKPKSDASETDTTNTSTIDTSKVVKSDASEKNATNTSTIDTSKVVKSDASGKNTTDAVNCAVTWGAYKNCNLQCLSSGQSNGVDSFETSTGTVTTQPKNGGTGCPAVLTKNRACASTPPPCVVDCELGPWSDWSACSEDCGGGVKSRTKSIETHRIGAGKSCPLPGTRSKTLETQNCNTATCPKIPIKGQVTVCGNGGADNCFSFDPCEYVVNDKMCQVVNQTSPIDLSKVGSKGDWPLLAWPAWCQLAGFPSVPAGIKITTYEDFGCTGTPTDDRGILEGGNCCKGFKNCTNTTVAAASASCANPPFAHGSGTTGQFACAFQVEVLPNYVCPPK